MMPWCASLVRWPCHNKMLPCPRGGQGSVSKSEVPSSKLGGCTRYFFSLVSLCLPLRALVEAFWFIFACFWPLKMLSIPASIVRQIWIAIYRWKALNVSFPTQLEAHQLDVCSSSYSPLKEAWSCCERPDFTLAKFLLPTSLCITILPCPWQEQGSVRAGCFLL